MPGFGFAIDAFKTRPFSTCITTLIDCGSVLSVVFFLDTDGTRIGFAAGSGCVAGSGGGIVVAGAAAATGGASAVLNPFVTAITVDKPTPISTAVTNNTDRCWTSVDVRAGG